MQPQNVCRVLFLVPQKSKAARIAQLISELNESEVQKYNEISIDILPAVAMFGSYLDGDKRAIRYLSSVEHYGPLATLARPQSLLPFFYDDETSEAEIADTGSTGSQMFAGISGVAIGPGLDDSESVSMIQKFFRTMTKKEFPIEVIRPNPEYSTMEEELAAFRELSKDEKEEAARLQRIGPARTARFVIDLAHNVVEAGMSRIIAELESSVEAIVEQPVEKQDQDLPPLPITETAPVPPRIINPNQTTYSCRKCRTTLFGEDDLEDPPHIQSRHRFSDRKINHGAVCTNATSSPCQSLFLRDGCPWIGDMSASEGKFTCPKCDTKVGTWQWSGSQCSCGTWVVPAIQIPKSKVDEMSPMAVGLPPGTVISPFVRMLADP